MIYPAPELNTGKTVVVKRREDKVLSEEEKKVHSLIESEKARYVDEIIEHSGLSSAKVMSILLRLEINKLIKQLPGKMFVRI